VGYALPAWAGGTATVDGGGGPGSVYADAGDCTSGDCVSASAREVNLRIDCPLIVIPNSS